MIRSPEEFASAFQAARRAESSTRAQTMAARQTRNGLRRHPDLPRVWVSNEFLPTKDVWACLLQKPNPRGNRPLYELYACCRAEWHSGLSKLRSRH
jgi:hypothetical protein